MTALDDALATAQAEANKTEAALVRCQNDYNALEAEFEAYKEKYPPVQPPTPTSVPRLGVYRDDDYGWKNVGGANYYVQPNQLGSGNNTWASAKTDVKAGKYVAMTLTAKGTQHLAGIANGVQASLDWLDQYVTRLSECADAAPAGTFVVGSLLAEAVGQVNQGAITGPSADFTTIGKAMNTFFEKMHAKNSKVLTTYWIVGYDRAKEKQVADQFKVKPKIMTWDPYANTSGTQTLASICNADIDWIKAQPMLSGIPLALGEYGMDIDFGDDACAKFFTDLPAQFAAIAKDKGITWKFATFFNRVRDKDHAITTPPRTDGKQFPKATAAYQASMTKANA